VNPRTGFEHSIEELPMPAPVNKKIAVVGSGPAGITFAIIAAGRGHDVTVYEKSDRVGGRVIAGSIPKIKYELDNYRAYLERQLFEAVDNGQVKLNLNTEADLNMLKEQAYDSIVLAAGTVNSTPKLPG